MTSDPAATDDDDDKPTGRPAGPNYMTPTGHARLAGELEHLRRVERPRVVNEVADAAAQGDRSENAEYIYGKRRLREIDRRVRFLMRRLDIAQIVDPTVQRGDRAWFGAVVDIEDEAGALRTWQIVGEDEVDAAAGCISHRSPIGAALLGKAAGDDARVQTPAGTRTYTIVDVRYG